jgi:hypothetical protein
MRIVANGVATSFALDGLTGAPVAHAFNRAVTTCLAPAGEPPRAC